MLKKERPRSLHGETHRVETPLGTVYVTINSTDEGREQPFELFIRTSKAGSETAAVAEAFGRLCSLLLRMEGDAPARERLREIMNQLDGIGGGHSTGLGADRVRSLSDGVAHVLRDFLDKTSAFPSEQGGSAEGGAP